MSAVDGAGTVFCEGESVRHFQSQGTFANVERYSPRGRAIAFNGTGWSCLCLLSPFLYRLSLLTALEAGG